MQKSGYVVFSDNKIAKIRIKRESSCGGNCSHCKGCGADELLIEVENLKGFQTGETVNIIMPDSGLLKKSLAGYGILVMLIIIGAILGYVIFENEFIAFLFMAVFLGAGLLILRFIFEKKQYDIKVERLD